MKIAIGTSLATFLSLAIAIPANAESITYDFTGTVFTATGIYSSVAIGSTVSGTYTIDYDNAVPSYAVGTVGETSETWQARTLGGTSVGLPGVAQFVFSSSLQDGSFSYSTNATSGMYLNQSSMVGYVSGQYDSLAGREIWSPDSSVSNSSSFQFFTPYSAYVTPVAPWTSAGRPIFSSANGNQGALEQIVAGGKSDLDYTINSFTLAPVPLPAGLWLMISGLGGLAALVRRRSV